MPAAQRGSRHGCPHTGAGFPGERMWFRRRREASDATHAADTPRGAILVAEHLEQRTLLSVAGPAAVGVRYPDYTILNSAAATASATVGGFSPSEIRRAYGFDQIAFANGTIAADGSGQTIAIVDA